MKKRSFTLAELQANALSQQQSLTVKGGDDKRDPRPGGGGVLPNSPNSVWLDALIAKI